MKEGNACFLSGMQTQHRLSDGDEALVNLAILVAQNKRMVESFLAGKCKQSETVGNFSIKKECRVSQHVCLATSFGDMAALCKSCNDSTFKSLHYIPHFSQ